MKIKKVFHKGCVFCLFSTSVCGFSALGLADEPVLDDTPTRVQTSLAVAMEEVGTLRPKTVNEIETSQWTLGCETMDREYTNYDRFKEYLPQLGIKRIRLQAGWARTEKDKGIYDFAWLDYVINDATSRGLEIWLETSYGNPIYPGGGGRTLADGFPTSAEALAAWDNWVTQMAKRYKGKVRDWCVWNEPDLNPNNSPERTAEFCIRTAEIIKREIPEARIAALAICTPNLNYIEPFLQKVKEENKLDLFHWVVYHQYTMNPDDQEYYKKVQLAREFVAKNAPDIKLWEGESGTQSEWCRSGAISRYAWSELTQAKWALRRMLADIGHGVDSFIFSAVDLDYRTTSFHNGITRYGLIKTAGAAQGYKVLKVKQAYYAVQNLVSVFNDALQWDENFLTDSSLTIDCERDLAVYCHRDKASGTPMIVFWDRTDVPGLSNETVPVTLTLKDPGFKEPVWCDLLTGNVYAVSPDSIVRDGDTITFKSLPAYDSPVFLTSREILTLDYSDRVLFLREKK
ncbi:MAG: beta-galactosidase [Planctomycetia bacterium]|nr:beta-galactosidase [Planctomycetia bacterium]